MANYSEDEQRVLTKEMSDKIYNDSYSTTEEELQTDANWIEATKDVYKQLEGVEWSGSDEDLAKKGLDMMSRFNYNLTLGTINYTAQLQDADPKTKLSFYYMMDMYDKKDISGNGVMRAFKEMGLDPASYIGIGTLGMGFAGKQAAATAAKTGLKSMLKQGAIKFLQSPTAVAATEGAIYTGVDDVARQDAAIGAGVQDEYSPGQTALATGIGAAAGAGIVQGTKAIGKGIARTIEAGEEEMARAAGGGTPPKIDNIPSSAYSEAKASPEKSYNPLKRTVPLDEDSVIVGTQKEDKNIYVGRDKNGNYFTINRKDAFDRSNAYAEQLKKPKQTTSTDITSKFQDDVNTQISKHGDLDQLDYNMMDISNRDLTRIQRVKNTIEEVQADPENAVYTASTFNDFQEYYPDQLKYAKIVPQIKGNKVKIYRSATGDIEPGDWIGLSKKYAESHGRTPEHKTYEMWVDKEDIRWQGADANEWIYLPKNLVDADIDFKGAK